MPHNENRPAEDGAESSANLRASTHTSIPSAQVNWWTVHQFVAAVLNQVNNWPMAGTPAWCSLAHDDPRKWAALLDAAQHWTLRVDACQEARAAASRAVAGALNWAEVSQEIRARQGVYIPRAAEL